MACGGRPKETLDVAINKLWVHDFYNGAQFGKFHVVRSDIPNRDIVGIMHTAWFEQGMRLNAVAVDPASRGQGLGKRIIETLADVAVQRSIDEIWLFAKPDGRVLDFYRSLGFTVLPPTDYRVDPETESRCVPMAAHTDKILDRPVDLIPIAGTIL